MHAWNEIWSDFENSRYIRPDADPSVKLHATTRDDDLLLPPPDPFDGYEERDEYGYSWELK